MIAHYPTRAILHSMKRTQKSKPYSVGLDAKLNRPAGIHKDQRRKSDPKQLRRDKSYKKEMH